VKAISGTGLAVLEGNGDETDWDFSGTGGGRSSSKDEVRGSSPGSPRPISELLALLNLRGILEEDLDLDPVRPRPPSVSNSWTGGEDEDLGSFADFRGLLGVTTMPRGTTSEVPAGL